MKSAAGRCAGVALTAAALFCSCAGTRSAAPASPLDSARDNLAHGAFEEARVKLERLHREAPEELDVARALVEASVKARRADALHAELIRSLARADRAVTHYMLGILAFAVTATARGTADQELARAAALEPNRAELHFRRGVALVDSEEDEAALPPLERAVSLAPREVAYRLPLARAYARLGRRHDAVETLRELVTLHPTPAQVQVARRVMDDLEAPFARIPQAARARLEAGLNWLKTADVPQEAITSFEDILRDYPDLATVHALLGLAYLRLDDAARALDELRRATELDPQNGENYLSLAQVYGSRQRLAAAQENLQKALDRNPLLDEAYDRLGTLALERQDLVTAERLLQTLTYLQPRNTEARVRLATARQQQGDWAGAEQTLMEGLGVTPKNVELMLRLALLDMDRRVKDTHPAARQRATAEAGRWLRAVLEVQPENALASRGLQALK